MKNLERKQAMKQSNDTKKRLSENERALLNLNYDNAEIMWLTAAIIKNAAVSRAAKEAAELYALDALKASSNYRRTLNMIINRQMAERYQDEDT